MSPFFLSFSCFSVPHPFLPQVFYGFAGREYAAPLPPEVTAVVAAAVLPALPVLSRVASKSTRLFSAALAGPASSGPTVEAIEEGEEEGGPGEGGGSLELEAGGPVRGDLEELH